MRLFSNNKVTVAHFKQNNYAAGFEYSEGARHVFRLGFHLSHQWLLSLLSSQGGIYARNRKQP